MHLLLFLIDEGDALIKQCIERAIKICKEQEIPIEERRIGRKKRMPGEHAEDVGLSAIAIIFTFNLNSFHVLVLTYVVLPSSPFFVHCCQIYFYVCGFGQK